jgi:hypothetical protein
MDDKQVKHVRWNVLIPILSGAFATIIAAATPLYLGVVERTAASQRKAEESGKKADVAYDVLRQHVQYLEGDIADIKKELVALRADRSEDVFAQAIQADLLASMPLRDIKKMLAQPPVKKTDHQRLSELKSGIKDIIHKAEGVGAGSGSGGAATTEEMMEDNIAAEAANLDALPKSIPPAAPAPNADKVQQQQRKALPTSLDDAVKGL